MIERQLLAQRVKHQQIQDFIFSKVGKAGYSHTEIQRTPLGEKIIIYTSKPGMVVGRSGENIKELTIVLKNRFNMENPQIEVAEIENPLFDAKLVARGIVSSFERFGPKRFKSLGYKALENIIRAGALGAEIVIAGRGVPSSRSRTWRFSAGYLRKCGDIAESQVKKGGAVAHLKSGAIGIKVSILTPDIQLPDRIIVRDKDLDTKVKVEGIEEVKEIKEEVKKEKPKKIKTKDKENGDNQKV